MTLEFGMVPDYLEFDRLGDGTLPVSPSVPAGGYVMAVVGPGFAYEPSAEIAAIVVIAVIAAIAAFLERS